MINEQNAQRARQHTLEMNNRLGFLIDKAVEKTKVYSPDTSITNPLMHQRTKIILDDIDTVSAIFKYHVDKTAALNFASYKEPGGKYLEGSMAQEESLCSKSNLYNILSKFSSYYEWNNEHKNLGLYTNRALYTPEVVFEDTKQAQTCDVITCAAPNWRSAGMYGRATKEENIKALSSRINFVLKIAREQKVDILILGAYGCGVFGQSAKAVATIFKTYIDESYQCFDTIVFAIPDKNSIDYKEFNEVLFKTDHKEPTSLF